MIENHVNWLSGPQITFKNRNVASHTKSLPIRATAAEAQSECSRSDAVATAVVRSGVEYTMDADRVRLLNDRCRRTPSERRYRRRMPLWQVLMVAGGVACGLLLLLMAAAATPVTVDWRSVRRARSGSPLPEDSVAPLASPRRPVHGRKPTAGSDSWPSTRCRHTQTPQMTMEATNVLAVRGWCWWLNWCALHSLTHSINPSP